MKFLVAGIILLFLLLIIPLSAVIYYEDELRIDLKWLFFKKTLFPNKKKEEPKTKPQGEDKAKKIAKPKEKLSPKEIIDTVKDYIKRCKGGAKMILKNLRVSFLKVHWVVTGEDAATCAINYGKANAYFYNAFALISHIIKIKKTDFSIEPDMIGEKDAFTATIKVSLTPLIAIIGLIRVAWGFMMKAISDQNKETAKGDKENEREERGRNS